MARRKAQKNYYVATDINGQMFSITAPNAKTARVVALNNDTPIINCQRVFKRGGNLSHQIMKDKDIINAKFEIARQKMAKIKLEKV